MYTDVVKISSQVQLSEKKVRIIIDSILSKSMELENEGNKSDEEQLPALENIILNETIHPRQLSSGNGSVEEYLPPLSSQWLTLNSLADNEMMTKKSRGSICYYFLLPSLCLPL